MNFKKSISSHNLIRTFNSPNQNIDFCPHLLAEINESDFVFKLPDLCVKTKQCSRPNGFKLLVFICLIGSLKGNKNELRKFVLDLLMSFCKEKHLFFCKYQVHFLEMMLTFAPS